jgi:hypothetical protein
MGRPPIGKAAMTAAERVRRYRQKHGVTKAPAESETIAALKSRIAELEAQVTKPVTKPVTEDVTKRSGDKRSAERIAALEAEVVELKQALAQARAASGAFPRRTAAEWAAAKLEAEEKAKALKAARKEAKLREAAAASVPWESEAVLRYERDEAQKRLYAKLTEIRNLKAKIRAIAAKSIGVVCSKKLHREIASALHPDRAAGDPALQKRLTKAFQGFNELKFTPIDEDT